MTRDPETPQRTKVAVLFNGQTAVRGIGQELVESSPEAAELYGLTSRFLGIDLSFLHLMQEDPDTVDVQFANTPYNIGSWERLIALSPDLKVDVVGGHSFGEAISSVPAKVVSYLNFLLFLRTRTELMRSVNEVTPGALMTITTRKSRASQEDGTTLDDISRELQERYGIEVATYASRNRQTMGGKLDAIMAAVDYSRAFRDYVVAKVISKKGAPHTSLYAPIVDDLREAVRSIPGGISDPEIPGITCSKPNPELMTTAQAWEDEIVAQATNPVYGDSQQRYLLQRGYTIIQLGKHPIIAENIRDDFGEDVEIEEITHTKRNLLIGAGVIGVGAVGLTLGWKVTRKEKKRREN